QQGGLEVRTTLDLNLQQQTEKIVLSEVERLVGLNVSNGAALVTNPQTGEILTMVGSKDYFDFENDGQVNVILRPRQPGSSIKPLTYALAFEEGQTPWTLIEDSPITYHIPGSEPYSPRNYDNKFHGKVTLRDALASSYNVPAVKTLAGLGVENLIDKAEEMGISTWKDRRRFGLSLTLGAGEVLMTDLAKVYGTFANGGASIDPDPFLKITNYEGDVLYQNKCFAQPKECQTNQTLQPLTAFRITSILADNRARMPAFGQFSILNIPNQKVAVKTGTTNDLRDNWTIGYTTDRLVGVWVGNNDNQSMSQIASGVTGASPIWNQIMRLMLDENNPHQFLLPDGYQRVPICTATGTLPCKGCPRITEEIFEENDVPKNNCNWQYFVKVEEQKATDHNREKIL
ncbi:MAG: penicillin-binding transpeptidase domain-containing protein, partial [Patescibacteria group bacterium]|nr:penicillin-binding transpeptidase domain-containing protein [Patescibacteria group bacterium]